MFLVQTQAVCEPCRPVGAVRAAQRTGHACVTYRDRIIVFGGMDGEYHYDDTWSYGTITKTCSELQCIGFTPAPRAGHAAAFFYCPAWRGPMLLYVRCSVVLTMVLVRAFMGTMDAI